MSPAPAALAHRTRQAVLLAMLCGTGLAWSQAARLRPAAGVAAPAAAASAPAPYIDRLIEGLPAQALDEAEAPAYDASGPPRYLRIDARTSTAPFESRARLRTGVSAQAIVETTSHGVLSLDASTPVDGATGTFTLRQRELPLAGGWRAQHELGVVERPAPSLTRMPSRIFVPSSVLLGATGQWDQAERGWQIQAAQGLAGRMTGMPVAEFERTGGQRSMVGLQTLQAGNDLVPQGWSAALMLESADRVSPAYASETSARVSARSALTTIRLDRDQAHLQAQAIHTRRDADGSERHGAWVDAEWQDGPRRHSLGAYHLDSGMGWVDQPMPEDLRGMYYRAQWRTRLWAVEGSVDGLQNLSGRYGAGYFASANGRLRLSRDQAVGAGLTLRHYAGHAVQTFADWRWQNGWGASGLRLETGTSRDSPQQLSLAWDQEWRTALGYALTSSLVHRREQAWAAGNRPKQSLWRAAVAGMAPLGASVQLRGNVDVERSSLGHQTWSANLGASWRITPQWSLEAQFTQSLGHSRQVDPLDPLAPIVTTPTTRSSRSVHVLLRHEFQAGSRTIPLGGQGLQGGGRVHGVVFYDNNRSGTQEASEAGVPGVIVLLDNRYSARTDAQGRFEFPLVAAGEHRVAVRNDSLPLPWSAADDEPLHVEVRLREEAQLLIPVQRSP